MSLVDLIKKGSLRGAATATPATFATHEPFSLLTVATLATIAVAKAPDSETAPDPDRWCWPNSSAMNTREIDTFLSRVALFKDEGLDYMEAEQLADRLVSRDREEAIT